MKFEKINIKEGKKRVLIAPLDWGLGHATRCIPIIYTLLSQNFEVIIAAEGPVKILLKKEIPNVVFTELKGYNISYSRKGAWLLTSIFMQLPKLLRRIYAEHKWLKTFCKAYKIDMVIADNRLGLYNATIPCFYITHQLKIKTGNRFTEWMAQKIHYRFINKYTACWVPDNEVAPVLAGILSHPKVLPQTPVKYLGPLSRFEKIEVEKKYDLLIILSGPEPQRSIFEELLFNELKTFTGTAVLVRGLPGNVENNDPASILTNGVITFNHLSATALNLLIQQSKMIVSRSGYTTIMDLVKLQQKAILVPTPGQTEQEYLAAYLMEKKIFYCIAQKHFLLQHALQQAADFSFANIEIAPDDYTAVIKDAINQLQ